MSPLQAGAPGTPTCSPNLLAVVFGYGQRIMRQRMSVGAVRHVAVPALMRFGVA